MPQKPEKRGAFSNLRSSRRHIGGTTLCRIIKRGLQETMLYVHCIHCRNAEKGEDKNENSINDRRK